MKIANLLLLTLLSLSSFSQEIQVYFNNDPSYSYTDPYRKIKKPGKDFEGILIHAIDNARISIDVAVQELNLTYLAKALVKARDRGVNVRILLEDSYNKTFQEMAMNPNLLNDDFWYAKIKGQEFFLDLDKDGRVTQREANIGDAITILRNARMNVRDDSVGVKALMHHKFMIVDGKALLVGSANFTRSGTHGDYHVPESIGNANAMMGISSVPLVKKFQAEFDLMWNGFFKNEKNKRHYRPISSTRVGQANIHVQFSPTNLKTYGWNNSVNGAIVREINASKRSFAANLYAFSSQYIANALYDLRKRNLRIPIELLADFNFGIQYWSETLDMWGVALKDPRCNIEKDNFAWKRAERSVGIPTMPRGDKLHHKFAVLDAKKVLFGSHNWSNSANTKNDETFMIIESEKVAAAFLREHRRLMSISRFGVPFYLRKKLDEQSKRCDTFI